MKTIEDLDIEMQKALEQAKDTQFGGLATLSYNLFAAVKRGCEKYGILTIDESYLAELLVISCEQNSVTL